MTLAPIRFRPPVRRLAGLLAVASAFGSALMPLDASALFIVNQPWVLPGSMAKSTRAYMNLTSTDGATLLGARSDDARRVSIRFVRAATPGGLPLPAKSEVALAPGRDHLVLTGLARTLRIGDRVAISLTVREDGGEVREIVVNAEVRHRSPIDDERRAHHHH